MYEHLMEYVVNHVSGLGSLPADFPLEKRSELMHSAIGRVREAARLTSDFHETIDLGGEDLEKVIVYGLEHHEFEMALAFCGIAGERVYQTPEEISDAHVWKIWEDVSETYGHMAFEDPSLLLAQNKAHYAQQNRNKRAIDAAQNMGE
jgi:hypothetical protein